MKRILKIILFVLAANTLRAQQIGMYAHYFYKPMVYNPAFTGTDGNTNAMLINRTQWSGIKGAPQLNIFTLDGNLTNKNAGLGITLISDRKGITKRTGGNISYSYKLKFNDDAHLLLGLSVGVIDQTIDYSKASIEDISDPTLFFNAQRKTAFDANAGLAFVWKGLEFGFAVPQLAGNKINYVENTDVRTYYTQARHFMGSLKYKFFISEEKGISIAPQMLIRLVPNAPFQYDGNINFDWKDKFWLGGTYKSNYAVGLNAGVHIHKQFSVGYSYDFITGKIGKYAGVSHEIMLNFRFGKNNKEEIVHPTPEEKRLDSLTSQLNELKEKTENKVMENAAYVKRMDSLSSQLEQSKTKIKELDEKLEKQVKLQAELPVISNQNKTVVEQNANKVMENNVWVITNSANDFKDAKNHLPKKGFYVIAGTFFYRDFAIAEAQRFSAMGFKGADWVFYEPKQYNYVFLYKVASKKEAFEKVNAAKTKGVNDAWIQVLVE